MSDPVLSNEEVETLLKVAQNKKEEGESVLGTVESPVDAIKNSSQTLSNICDLTRNELEKSLTTFYRNKIFLKSNPANVARAGSSLSNEENNNVYIAFRLLPTESYGIINISYNLIHQTINILYGGKVNPNDKIITNPGKVGMIIADKIAEMFLDAFIIGCKDFVNVTCEPLKSTTTLNLAFNYGIEREDEVYVLDYSLILDENENKLKILISQELVTNSFVKKVDNNKVRQKDFWREAIKNQVVDSIVNVNITLADIPMRLEQFSQLKEGDLLPIEDPTHVYVCLNNYKLFHATAGQSNSNLVVKVTQQI